MGRILKAISGFYLAVMCLVAFLATSASSSIDSIYGPAAKGYVIVGAVLLALPAIALYAFGQLVDDTRKMRNDTAAMLDLLRNGR
jgi:hypothetical protein